MGGAVVSFRANEVSLAEILDQTLHNAESNGCRVSSIGNVECCGALIQLFPLLALEAF